MVDERLGRNGDIVENPNHRKTERSRDSMDGGDFISSMPDDILHHVFFYIPTDSTVKTSVLSRRWRHVWSESPYLYYDDFRTKSKRLDQTLTSYTSPKIKSFHLRVRSNQTAQQIDNWIEFAISRNVEKLSFNFNYTLTKFFSLSKYVKPSFSLSWKPLRNLLFASCNLPDASIANILSGCPKLESLSLHGCHLLDRLDLSESMSLTRLEIVRNCWATAPTEIVAPHIRYLKFVTNDEKPCTLVDVSSLTQADVDIFICPNQTLKFDFLQTMALEMLAKLQNIERLIVGEILLQILSLTELCGRVHLPTFNVENLIINTGIFGSVIPGIARLLQNSPGLKKLEVHTMHRHIDYIIQDKQLDRYLVSQGLNTDQCWRSKYHDFPTTQEFFSMLQPHDAMSKLLASFLKLVLRNAKTLEKVVVRLRGIYFDDAKWFEEQLQMVQTLSRDSNVSIKLTN